MLTRDAPIANAQAYNREPNQAENREVWITLAYGHRGLPVRFRRPVEVIEPEYPPALPDPDAALREALRAPIHSPPLRDIVRDGATVTIVVCDGTRPAPTRQMLEAVLRHLSHLPSDRFTILVATGLHRPTREDELAAMLGPEILRTYRVVNHDPRDPAGLREIGRTRSGRPLVVSRTYLDADTRITLGLIEPHFFAGFSGGAKLILPGVAGEASILRNHDAEMIGDPNARWGVREGNPIFQEQREAARLAGCEFVLNVLINQTRQITHVFAGALEPAHDAGCRAALRVAMRPVAAPFDVVVTTNGGYPLDQNLYQAVKGMDAAAQIVRRDGDIVMAAECREGVGHGAFVDILREHADPAAMLRAIEAPGPGRQDQWQNQVFARVLKQARVHLHASGLSADEIRAAFCEPCPQVAERVHELADGGARVCVLPRGPETIPYLNAG